MSPLPYLAVIAVAIIGNLAIAQYFAHVRTERDLRAKVAALREWATDVDEVLDDLEHTDDRIGMLRIWLKAEMEAREAAS